MYNIMLHLAFAFYLWTFLQLLIAPSEGDFGRKEEEDQRKAVTSPRGPAPPPKKRFNPG